MSKALQAADEYSEDPVDGFLFLVGAEWLAEQLYADGLISQEVIEKYFGEIN